MDFFSFGVFLCQVVASFFLGNSIPQSQPSNPVVSMNITNINITNINITNINITNNVNMTFSNFTNINMNISNINKDIVNTDTVNIKLIPTVVNSAFILGEADVHPSIHRIVVKKNIPTRGLHNAVIVIGCFENVHEVFLVKEGRGFKCEILSNKKASCPILSGAGISYFYIEIAFKNEKIKSQTQYFKYAPPVIDRIIQKQASPTSGNLLVTIVGKNFGACEEELVYVHVSVGNFGTVPGSLECFNEDCSKEMILFFTPPGFGMKNFVHVFINGLLSKTSDHSISYASPVIHQMYPLPSTNYHGKLTLIGENFGISTPNLEILVSIGTTKCDDEIEFFDDENETIVCFIDYEKTEDLNLVSVQINSFNEVQIARGTNSLYMFEIPKVIHPLITIIGLGLGNHTSIYIHTSNTFSSFPVELDMKEDYDQLVLLYESEAFLILFMDVIFLIFILNVLSERISTFLLNKKTTLPFDLDRLTLFFGVDPSFIATFDQPTVDSPVQLPLKDKLIDWICGTTTTVKEVGILKLTEENENANEETSKIYDTVRSNLKQNHPEDEMIIDEIYVIVFKDNPKSFEGATRYLCCFDFEIEIDADQMCIFGDSQILFQIFASYHRNSNQMNKIE